MQLCRLHSCIESYEIQKKKNGKRFDSSLSKVEFLSELRLIEFGLGLFSLGKIK
jgi:hypothetical protein